MDTDEHNLSDIIEIISPELNGAPFQPHTAPHSAPPTRTSPQRPYIRIVVQPTKDDVRFRYESEGRSAGSIPGDANAPDSSSIPTVEIVGFNGEAVMVASCVTNDEPYRPHPHKLVGKDCKDGICTKRLRAGQPLRFEFSGMGIQCARRKDVLDSLAERQSKDVDPFRTGFEHKNNPIELNKLRLCFQAYMRTVNNRWEGLTPVVSDTLFDRKANNGLKINRLCSCSATVDGGDEIILLCEKVKADNIRVRFKAIVNDKEVWHAYADFEPTHVHKQTAIAFRTPRFAKSEYPENVKTFIELERPNDGATSKALDFEFHYGPGMLTFTRLRRKLKRRPDLDVFQQILSLDSETTATKYSCPPTDLEGELGDRDTETVSTESSASKPQSLDTLNEYDSCAKRQTDSVTDEDNDDVLRANGIDIELEVPQINYPAADESTQTSTPMEEILKYPQLAEPRQLSAIDKITEWMRSSEFERTDSLTVENGDTASLSPVTVYTNVTSLSANNHTTISTTTDEDKTFTDLMEQVAELDEMITESQSRRGTLDNPIIKELSLGNSPIAGRKLSGATVEAAGSASTQHSVEVDESFDETATYTSLQIAFKHPIDIPLTIMDKNSSVFVNEEDGLVVLKNPPAPKIRVNAAQTPPSPPTPPLPLPPRTPSPVPEQQLPPLPPKRKSSQECSSAEPTPRGSVELSRNSSISSRPPSQIIIMRTPDQSPTKRQPTPSASPKKRQGFFSRLFSRRKSKAELASEETSAKSTGSKVASPNGSREPSIGHFSLSDPNRSSLRSIKSLQPPNSPGLSPQNNAACAKSGKPVGRSASSVSGKRPAHLNADVIHIPLKGASAKSLPQQEAKAFTFGQYLDRKTLSALQLADIPISDGHMELVAIADRQSIKNLCEGEYGVVLDPSVDLGEAEHFALYTSVSPQSNANSSAGNLKYYGQMDDEQVVSADEIARRLAEANGLQ